MLSYAKQNFSIMKIIAVCVNKIYTIAKKFLSKDNFPESVISTMSGLPSERPQDRT